jgi:hypothetical protein
MRLLSRRSLGLACAVASSWPVIAHAQADDAKAAAAERLFELGRAALEAGRYAEACPELRESQSLDPANGTLLALAMCHEAIGRTATAWREFQTARAESARTGRPDRVTLTAERLRVLEPKLSRLTVSVAPDAPVEVRLDGDVLGRDAWGKPLAVDPGDHRVEASRGGAPLYTRRVTVGADGDCVAVVVPDLAETAEPSGASDGRRVGWALAGSGVALLGVGAFFGVRAGVDHDRATTLCPSSPCANADGVAANDRARTEAWVSDLGVGLGVAAVAVGAYFLLLRHEDAPRSAAVRWVPVFGPARSGLDLAGRW